MPALQNSRFRWRIGKSLGRRLARCCKVLYSLGANIADVDVTIASTHFHDFDTLADDVELWDNARMMDT